MLGLYDGIRTRLGDQRGFIHKKILGGISKISGLIPLPATRIISGVTGALAGRGRTVPRTQVARPTVFSEQEKQLGRQIKFGPGTGFGGPVPTFARVTGPAPRRVGASLAGECPEVLGECRFPCKLFQGRCVFPFLGDRPGKDPTPIGEAVMGQYGAGLVPGNMPVDRAVCLRGMQLGNDGVCYNKSQISNKQRMWPAGRKPLLTGGDMRAISTAARAGRRMDLATKRLQKMGMMKKPVRRGAMPHARLLEAHVTSKH